MKKHSKPIIIWLILFYKLIVYKALLIFKISTNKLKALKAFCFLLIISSVALGQDSLDQRNNKRNLLFLNQAVESRYRPELNEKVKSSNDKIDLDRFPLISYKVDTTKIGYVIEGEIIPDIILDMPLKLVNDPTGKSATTLRELSNREFLILDFWAKWCKPCLESMDKWESLNDKIDDDIRVVGVHLDFDYKAVLEVNSRGWKLPQIVGAEGYLLNHYLLSQSILGPSAWIRDGKLYGVSKANISKYDYLKDVINNPSAGLPDDVKYSVKR